VPGGAAPATTPQRLSGAGAVRSAVVLDAPRAAGTVVPMADTRSFYDSYAAFPLSIDHDDERVVAHLNLNAATGDGVSRGSASIEWIDLHHPHSPEPADVRSTYLVRLTVFHDGFAAMADVCLVELLAGLADRPTPTEVIDALTDAGWVNRTDDLATGTAHCPTCGHDGWHGPGRIRRFAHRLAAAGL
jgi:hypothetical protein